jgi:signal transduction histidine kinase
MDLAITHSSKLVSNLLDFARQKPPDLKPIEISKIIDHAISLVGHQAQLTKIKLIREETPSLPLVKGDSGQLQQVLINLIVNAIQAMPNGGELKIISFTKGDLVKVAINDVGEGIPPENMDKLFTPFFSTKDEVKGVGLGLAVSYGIIKSHGGNIEVQSQIGKGSTFTISLPAYCE